LNLDQANLPGGYAAQAETLLARWAKLDVETVCAPVLPFLTQAAGRALDIGSGAGNTAAWLSELGWTVTAVEPVKALRDGAQRLNPSRAITWLDDALPQLKGVARPPDGFDLIVCFAVLMHVPPSELGGAIGRVANLLAPSGKILISLRHGPLPDGRGMHPVATLGVITLAEQAGLRCTLCEAHPSHQAANRALDVVWTWLLLER